MKHSKPDPVLLLHYEKLKKCIHVSILDFIHFPEDTDCYRTIGLVNRKTNALYSDKLELQVLELKSCRRR